MWQNHHLIQALDLLSDMHNDQNYYRVWNQTKVEAKNVKTSLVELDINKNTQEYFNAVEFQDEQLNIGQV